MTQRVCWLYTVNRGWQHFHRVAVLLDMSSTLHEPTRNCVTPQVSHFLGSPAFFSCLSLSLVCLCPEQSWMEWYGAQSLMLTLVSICVGAAVWSGVVRCPSGCGERGEHDSLRLTTLTAGASLLVLLLSCSLQQVWMYTEILRLLWMLAGNRGDD